VQIRNCNGKTKRPYAPLLQFYIVLIKKVCRVGVSYAILALANCGNVDETAPIFLIKYLLNFLGFCMTGSFAGVATSKKVSEVRIR